MPQPTASEVHVDAALSQISVAYVQSRDDFIAGKVFPQVRVDKQSDKYFTYTKADWFRDEAEKRAPGTESAGTGFGISSTNTYFADIYALHQDVPDRVRQNADAALDPDRDATRFITQRMLLRQEMQWVTEYFSSGVWGTTVTPGNLWSSFTTSDPIGDIDLGTTTVAKATGFMPNTLVLGFEVWQKLRRHPDIVDQFKFTSSESVTTDMLAGLLGLDNVFIAKAIKNTTAEGVTASYSFTHGKDALLCWVTDQPGLLMPSAGYNFIWQGVSEGLQTDIGISRFRMDELKADRIEGEIAFDMKVVASDVGYFLNNVVS